LTRFSKEATAQVNHLTTFGFLRADPDSVARLPTAEASGTEGKPG